MTSTAPLPSASTTVVPPVRIASIPDAAPENYRAMHALSRSVRLDDELRQLIDIRVSQINGCAFCLKFHLSVARKAGVPQEKLDLLAAWRDAGLFSARERAALAYAEAMTELEPGAASDDAWASLRAEFSEDEALHLTVTVAGINAWNRIAIGLSFAPPA